MNGVLFFGEAIFCYLRWGFNLKKKKFCAGRGGFTGFTACF